ncbi:bifunctional enoyl-CoA hydratase/phosphate acetyltransferase [Pseudomonas sp. C27(2019)]|uniref:bifunctional enoyl-CoA hydratase/phosphate acetyltransferase n=1 Tax=Pseudomonas sp. C27(2019) TaxID=2604941 RepID=UPI001244F36C|nr:bifunctional enoyl-CoA hydratase/phosphate acetyltransferase [Pseudomonas sp. C27(2019)]QEY59478.1 bifunctional enoyl-CoA hydratase/phosphate acetyltransferase [Pseudomonas sp. C27(2019)]
MEYIENSTFDEIQIGDSASLERRLTMADIKLFAVLSGDSDPAHVDEDYAKSSTFHEAIAHGLWGGALISAVLGTQLPGPGTLYLNQNLSFHRSIGLGDVVTVTVKVIEKKPEQHRVTLDCRCVNQQGETVISGAAEVRAPTEKVKRPRRALPDVHLAERLHLHRLMEGAKQYPAMRTAVVHPVDKTSLIGAVAAAEHGLIEPILIGPEHKIRAVAEAEQIDLSPYRLVDTRHSHAAAEKAVALARAGEVDALMKGSLHTDELLSAVVARATGLRTERRISHVFAFDVPTYAQPLFITDAAINITPTLEDKRDITQNAIDLAHALGIEQPKVAVLSAVETVTAGIQSTLDAAALCKMADRGQITGAIIDGPLALDNAVSAEAAAIKGIVSPVAGQADILIVPDLVSGNMLAKQLEYLGGAESAGILLGASVPIVLTSRADDTISRLASCALAVLLFNHQREALA